MPLTPTLSKASLLCNDNCQNAKKGVDPLGCNKVGVGPNACVLSFDVIFSSPEPLGSQGELIVYPSSRRPSVRRPSSSSVVVNNFKHLLLRNRWADQSQILCGASLDRGNDILFAASGSHDQDGRHAHIW